MKRSYPKLINLISESPIEEKRKKEKKPETVEEELDQQFNPEGNMILGYHKLLRSSIQLSKDKAKTKCENKGGTGEPKFNGPYKSTIDGQTYVICTMKKKANESLSRGSLYRKRYYGRY